jgi:hypothetical protein
MQVKIERTQRESGLVSKKVVFCIDARVEFTQDELRSIERYKLGKEIIYFSEAARLAHEKTQAHLQDSRANAFNIRGLGSTLKAAGSTLMTAMHLTISINSLSQGQHVECKTLAELQEAEEAILTACKNLKGYLTRAATFDGRATLYGFTEDGEVEIIAQAEPRNNELIAPPEQLDGSSAVPESEPLAAAYKPYEEATFDEPGTSFSLDDIRNWPNWLKGTVGALAIFLGLWFVKSVLSNPMGSGTVQIVAPAPVVSANSSTNADGSPAYATDAAAPATDEAPQGGAAAGAAAPAADLPMQYATDAAAPATDEPSDDYLAKSNFILPNGAGISAFEKKVDGVIIHYAPCPKYHLTSPYNFQCD